MLVRLNISSIWTSSIELCTFPDPAWYSLRCLTRSATCTSPDLAANEHGKGSEYLDLGDEIRNIEQNLENVDNIIENALQRRFEYGLGATQGTWDPTSLRDIVGDYYQTLTDCKHIVQQNLQFRSNNVVQNIRWSNVLLPRIEGLRERVRLHNLKVREASMALIYRSANHPLRFNLFCSRWSCRWSREEGYFSISLTLASVTCSRPFMKNRKGELMPPRSRHSV